MKPEDLRVNHCRYGLGINPERTVFSWLPPDGAQAACQVVLDGGWDSGRVETSAPLLAYSGPALPSRTRFTWRVRIWDRNGRETPWSEPAWFETPLAESDWQGPWIAMEGMLVPLFRAGIEIGEVVASARWTIACGGLFEARINGAKLGDQVLAPDHTDYSHRVTAFTFDVTDGLRTGENVAAVILGGGWFERHGYGRRCFRSQLETLDRDGRRRAYATMPRDWRVRQGPWTAEDIVHGEWYDARLEAPGWDRPGYVCDAGWHPLGLSFGKPPNAAEPPGGAIVGVECPPARVTAELAPVEIRRRDERRWLVDFGRQFAGWLRLRGRAPAGTTVTIRMGESLGPDGRVSQLTNKGARGTNAYTFRGDGTETWSARFSYQGFRFAEVEGVPDLPTDLDVRGLVVHSDCPVRGFLRTNHAGLNALFDATLRTIQSNLFGLLTDCPQRDERQGWLADAWAVSPVVLAWFDCFALYRKWMTDMAGIQDPSTGWRWSPMAPPCPKYLSRPPRERSRHRCAEVTAELPQSDSVYTAGATIIPWQYYLVTGEPGHLAHYYPLVAAHLGAMRGRPDFPLVETSWHGDHGAMGFTMEPPASTPKEFVAAAVLLQEVLIAGKMAAALGRAAEAASWHETAGQVRRAIHERFWAGDYGSQAANGMALELGVVPDGERPRVLRALLDDLDRRGHHLTSGVVATPYVLRALSENGHVQAALEAVAVRGEPGLLWMLEGGWTTLGEHLAGKWPDLSRNQPAWGLVCDWMLRYVAGLRIVETHPGYERVRIAPGLCHGVDWVEAELQTLRGPLRLSCRRGGTLEVALPPTTTAQIGREEVAGGEHRFAADTGMG